METDLTKPEISEAFLDLEWKQRYRVAGALQDADSPFKLDKSAKVTQRNRYGNIQPWADSRIQLRMPIGGSDYINASPIKLQSISRRAIKQLKRTSSTASASSIKAGGEYSYIATQGPKDGQFAHFWHMVMQESIGDTGVIIMLTPCYEGNKEKCAQYFPFDKAHPIILAPEQRNASNSDVVTAVRDDGDLFLNSPYRTTGSNLFRSEPQLPTDDSTEKDHNPPHEMTEAGTVELLSSTYDTEIGCVVRTLKLTIGSQEKTVIHYLYEHWPDFGKPEAEERAALLRLMKKSKEDAGESPRVVHCSAGVGRTGTFVALDFLTAELGAGRLASRTEDLTETTNSTSDAGAANNGSIEQGNSRPDAPPTNNTTYGKSGIARSKITTPELKQGETSNITGDLIHDTVDALRQQRMMMVMNEVQYSLLYEVVRDAFLDMYAEKATGAVVVPGTDEGDRNAKAARKSAGSQRDGDEEMVLSSSSPIRSQDGEVDSDADTEIAGMTPRAEDTKVEHDPYAEVAP
jgi:protein tyrosine phosphatase